MMDCCGVKLMLLMVMMSGFSISSAELLRPPQPPQHNYAFNKFRPPPPPPEPTFIQRITSWIFPWGGVSNEEEFRQPAAAKIDNQVQQRPLYHQQQQFQQQNQQQNHQPIARINPVPVRDTEPTTARTTPGPPITKCSPCNKVPWIPMMPTYQMPLVNSGGQHQVYFKHHFDNENPYAQVPAGKYGPPGSTQIPAGQYGPPGSTQVPASKYGAPGSTQVPAGHYGPPSSTHQSLTTPIKFQDGPQGFHHYGAPPIKNVQNQGYQYPTAVPKATTYRPNSNTIDTSVITFTTGRPQVQNNRPSRFTAAGSITNPEYLPPPNVLPLEGENSGFQPIPIPNLSPTPIPPLFDAKPFHHDPYRSQKTGFIKLVPLEPVAQVSNNVNIQVKPERNLPQLEAVKESPAVEVINSNLVAEFTIGEGTLRNDFTTRPPVQQNFFNLDVGNNLDANTTISAPIIVESLETATDNLGAGSEHDYEHNINQALEAPSNRLKDSDDDPINAQESNRVVPSRDSFNEDSDEVTTEGRYIVKFEPSLQTAEDLAEESTRRNKIEPAKKRPTPLELLDSPIFHVTPITSKPSITEPPPPFKPMEDFTKKLATLWTSPIPISTSTDPTPTPTFKTTSIYTTTSTSPPTSPTTVAFLSKLSSGLFAGITPPKEPPKPAPSTKKPKQIQIVIPYTTFHKPSPFKVQEEQEILTYRPIRGHYVTHPTKKPERNDIKSLKIDDSQFNGHGYHNDQEYPDHAQESKIVESKVTIEPARTTKYLTKILANNIRDLLKNEKTPKPPKIDLIKLQKNIDGWTEQSFLGKASTIALMGHTKAIPRSFLSTTMRATTVMKLPTTTLSPRTTFDPDLMEETKRQYSNILYKRDDNLLYVKRHDRFLDRDNEHVLINNNLTYNSLHDGVKVFAPKTTLTPKELWKRLHLTVSPLTNEKIYVVTPQPANEVEDAVSTFRPRFAVRPTVGSELKNSSNSCEVLKNLLPAARKQLKKLSPEISRRSDDRLDFVHFDGDSKVRHAFT